MTATRDAVLARIRAALAAAPPEDAVVPRDYRRTGSFAPGSRGAVDLLADRLTDYRATVVRCDPTQVEDVLAAQLAEADVVVPAGLPSPWVRGLRAAGTPVRLDEPGARLTHAELDATAAVLTGCRVAIAETGTIVLDGGPDQGRRALTLLPDRHVCVVRAEQVVASVPEGVARLAERPHRPLTWISGPSATSDIELVRVEGVHGPRDLRVVLVEG